MVRALDYFTAQQVERARRYLRPLYWSMLGDLAIGLGLLGVLSLSSWGDWVYRQIGALSWWERSLAFTGITLAVGFVLRLPLSYWRGYVHEKQWGFSTQSVWGWFADRLKGLGIGLVLTSGILLGFLSVARALPSAWPAALAPAGALLVLCLSFIAPVIVEPIFNKFEPLGDEDLSGEIRALADKAGLPVAGCLVADASRRSRKHNAYVSGLGPTRRVVLFDTLLEEASPSAVRVVVAHELGHRRLKHVAKGTVLGMAGAAASVAILWAVLRSPAVLSALGARNAGDPRVIPFLMLVALVLELGALAPGSALSRRWEAAADRFSLRLTGDLVAFEEEFRSLALTNLLDLSPPRVAYLLFFTHPTPPERIRAARHWAEEGPQRRQTAARS